jgi:DNA primase
MDQVEQVRRKVDIVDLISETVPLKKAGRNFKALCPFHDEKTPSFMVSPERQIFKCFGCGLGGDVFKFVMEREKIEFGEALRLLADRVGVELTSFRPSRDQQLKDRILEINHLASEFYHYLLTKHTVGKKALQYLLKRGVRQASIRQFKLGYAPNEWEALERYLVNKKGYRAEELEQAGLVIQSSQDGSRRYYDRFRGRVIFPLFDHRKRVVGFSGRVLPDFAKAPRGEPAKYINSPETLVYHKSEVLYGLEATKDEIKKANKAVVVEGELDAISSYQAGVKNVVAIKGSALTEGQIELLKRFCENLALALDADAAGDMAARRGIELAERAGLSVRVIELKLGKDPDECAQTSSRAWKDSVKTAVPVYDFYIQSALKRFGVKTPEGKRQVSAEVSPILAQISNEVIKAHYVKKLAEVLGVSEEAVAKEVEKGGRTITQPEVKPQEKETPRTRPERLEEYSLALILQAEEEIRELLKLVDDKILSEGAVKKVMGKLKQWLGKHKKWQAAAFIESLPAELGSAADTAYLTDLGKIGEDEEKLERELRKTIKELKRFFRREKLEKLSKEIKAAEQAKNKQKLIQLRGKFAKLSVWLKGE